MIFLCVKLYTRKNSTLTQKFNLFCRFFKNTQKKLYARTEKILLFCGLFEKKRTEKTTHAQKKSNGR